MADGPEDVLELDPDAIVDGEEQQTDGEAEEGEVTDFTFDGEEAAPASESSVIRDFRKRDREKDRRIAELERQIAPKQIEVGVRPALADFDYDEDGYAEALDAWNDRKAKKAEQDRASEERKAAEAKVWGEFEDGYRTEVAKLNVPNFDEAESEVADALPREVMALILRTKKPGLILALRNSPGKLAELSKLNLADAALMLGGLAERLQMGTRRPPDPDRPLRGNIAPMRSADKELARLEKEAARTGDRTKLAEYRRKLKPKA